MARPDVEVALARLLGSEVFAKARSMCRLLQFLIDQHFLERKIKEHEIGVAVFGRDPLSYHTLDDPIVRVQVGRLRERLKTYYATVGRQAGVEIAIPVGSYMPVIRRLSVGSVKLGQRHMLAVRPVRHIGAASPDADFACGLSEELSDRLFQEFGNKIVAHTFSPAGADGIASQQQISHVLEGSVRLEGGVMRASFRLVDALAGGIAWSRQFDRRAPFAIALQEELAQAVCASLQDYFTCG